MGGVAGQGRGTGSRPGGAARLGLHPHRRAGGAERRGRRGRGQGRRDRRRHRPPTARHQGPRGEGHRRDRLAHRPKALRPARELHRRHHRRQGRRPGHGRRRAEGGSPLDRRRRALLPRRCGSLLRARGRRARARRRRQGRRRCRQPQPRRRRPRRGGAAKHGQGGAGRGHPRRRRRQRGRAPHLPRGLHPARGDEGPGDRRRRHRQARPGGPLQQSAVLALPSPLVSHGARHRRDRPRPRRRARQGQRHLVRRPLRRRRRGGPEVGLSLPQARGGRAHLDGDGRGRGAEGDRPHLRPRHPRPRRRPGACGRSAPRRRGQGIRRRRHGRPTTRSCGSAATWTCPRSRTPSPSTPTAAPTPPGWRAGSSGRGGHQSALPPGFRAGAVERRGRTLRRRATAPRHARRRSRRRSLRPRRRGSVGQPRLCLRGRGRRGRGGRRRGRAPTR